MQKINRYLPYFYLFLGLLIVLIFLFNAHSGIYDWDKELFYATTIKESLIQHRSLPYMLWNREPFSFYPVVGQSAIFISYPETFLFSPFIPLLIWLSPLSFLKVVYFIHFLIGALGVIALKHRIGWRDDQLRIFSALFLLSPIILQHVAIGYMPWVNLFFFPWLLYFLFLDDRFIRCIGIALVISISFLNGGTHVAFWFGLFVAFFYVWSIVVNWCRWQLLVDVIFSGLLTILLGFARIYSSFLVFKDFSQKFFAGYSLRAFLRMTLIPPLFFIENIDDVEMLIEHYIDGVPYWDGGIYWGLTLFLVLILLVGFLANKNFRKKDRSQNIALPIISTSLTLLFLSFGMNYEILTNVVSHVTIFRALQGIEKYPFRFAIMAYMGFAFFIGHDYPNLLRVWHQTGNFLIRIVKRSCEWVNQYLVSKRMLLKKFLAMLIVLFTLLLVFNIWIKPFFLETFHAVISQAYDGQGWKLLSQYMVNKDVLPLSAYLQKGDAFINMFLSNLLLTTCLLILVIVILVYPMVFSFISQKIIQCFLDYRVYILEILIVMPLFFASLMWLRVAISTPFSSYARLSEEPILIKSLAPASAELNVVSHTPERFELTCQTRSLEPCQLVVDIPFSDSEFIIASGNTKIQDQDGLMGITIPSGENAILQFEKRSFIVAMLISTISWLVMLIVLWFRLRMHKKREPYGQSGQIIYQKIDKN